VHHVTHGKNPLAERDSIQREKVIVLFATASSQVPLEPGEVMQSEERARPEIELGNRPRLELARFWVQKKSRKVRVSEIAAGC